MAAILRVKRKNTDIPLDTLVIACKRLKTEASLSDAPTVQTVAQFAGTLTDPTEDVAKHMAQILPKISVESHKSGVKRVSDNDYPASISGKIPKWIDVDSVTERYKITDSIDTSSEEKDKWMTLIDVEDCWSISRLTNLAAEEDIGDYVYDLYYAQTGDDIWLESNNILVQQPEYPDVAFVDEDDDSSDSNAESHWKNDYPDTDPDRSSSSENSSDFDIFKEDKPEKDKYEDRNKDNDIFRCSYTVGKCRYTKRHDFESSDSDLSNRLEKSSDNEERSSDDEVDLEEESSDDEKMENI